MTAGLLDSVIYGALWASPALAALFEERRRTEGWLEVLAVLAEVEAAHDVIPPAAARAIASACRGIEVDAAFLEEVRGGREASGHSTAGLIAAVARRCEPEAGAWVHHGATVQDVTDSWLMATLRDARAHVAAELDAACAALAALARRHRDTPMVGRTHGQHGLPITFGFKVAGWLAELRRHRARLREIAPRMDVGQLAGGVGSLAAFGPRALELQAAFCARLGLAPPAASWTSSRDVLAEWGGLLALIAGSADRIGHEVYNLSRSEIGELAEAAPPGTIGSVTMPHKKNPELAEHLGTLARVVRHHAGCLAEGLVHDHERDGRSWKVEWLVVPELTILAGRAVELLAELARGLVVREARMRANLEAAGGAVFSEALLLALARRVGGRAARARVAALAAAPRFADAARADPGIRAILAPEELEAVFDVGRATGQCGALVDRLLAGEVA
jgi:adenylosuccinate lyase